MSIMQICSDSVDNVLKDADLAAGFVFNDKEDDSCIGPFYYKTDEHN